MLAIAGMRCGSSTSWYSPKACWFSTRQRRPSCSSATAGRCPICSPPWPQNFPMERQRPTFTSSWASWPGKDCSAMPATPRPLALLAELTYRCPLQCPYCSNPLELRRYRDELDASTWKRVLAEAAELGVVQIHFSGGEPLVRRDLAELVRE